MRDEFTIAADSLFISSRNAITKARYERQFLKPIA